MENATLSTKRDVVRKKVLLVGPLPPPIGGATLTFQTFAEEWILRGNGGPQEILNTSPRYHRVSRRIGFSDFSRGIAIGYRLFRLAPRFDAVLVFLTNGFFFRYSAILEYLRKLYGCSFFVSFFGSSLYDDIQKMRPRERSRMLAVLGSLDGVIVETEYLRRQLLEAGVSRAVTVPGYRKVDWGQLPGRHVCSSEGVRVVFLSQVKREKGIFVLLEAMSILSRSGLQVSCDIYGPVDPAITSEFYSACSGIPNVSYRGIIRHAIPETLARYDILALPTWHDGEGHPGVIIEAMIAGTPVIASRFRAIPELIEHGENGLLVEPGSVEDLVHAISYLARHPEDRLRMGNSLRDRLHRHDVSRAVDVVYGLISGQ